MKRSQILVVAILVVIAVLLGIAADHQPFLGLGKTSAPQIVASEKSLVTEVAKETPSPWVASVTPKPPTLWPTPLPGWSWMTPVVSAPPTACTAAGGVTVVLNDGDNFKIGKESFEWDVGAGMLSDGPDGPYDGYLASLELWQEAANRDGTYRIYRCGYDKFVIWEAAKLLPLLPTATPTRTPVLTIVR